MDIDRFCKKHGYVECGCDDSMGLSLKEYQDLNEKMQRYWSYVQKLRGEGVINCSDCEQELSESELQDNYEDPICNNCARALKH